MTRAKRAESNARPGASGRASDQQKNQEKEGSALVNDTVAPALTWRNGRSTRIDPDTRWVQWSVVGLVAMLGLASFIISFRALYDVAAWAGLGASIQWAVPVFIDGAILTYALAVLVHRSRGEPTWPSWLSLAVFTAMSIAANAAHAVSVPQAFLWQTVIGALIAGLAPLGVFAATEQMARLVVLRPMDRDAAATARPAPHEAAAAIQPATTPAMQPATQSATEPARVEEPAAPVADPVAEQSAGTADARDHADAGLPLPVADPEPGAPQGAVLATATESIPEPVPASAARTEEPAKPAVDQWRDDAAPVLGDDRAQWEHEVREGPEAAVVEDESPEGDGFAAWVLDQRQRGLPVTGPTAGEFLEVSERTGRNRIKELRAARPELFEEVSA